MSVTGIIIAAVIVGGTGLFIGAFLGIAGKKFAVEVDEREEAITGVLPEITVVDVDMQAVQDLPLQSSQGKRKLEDVRSVVLRLRQRLVKLWDRKQENRYV